MSDGEDDFPKLSTDTLKALQEFYDDKAEKDRKLNEQLIDGENPSGSFDFDEDWQLSQFWYDEDTIEVLAQEAIHTVGPDGKIALISCPSLFPKIKALAPAGVEVVLFEYDKKFAVYGSSFVFYDYKAPLDVHRNLASKFDLVIFDPPFLSEDCLTKVSLTAKFLAKDKLILCTGLVMEKLANRLLAVKKCKFIPKHRNNLANEFGCFKNYQSELEWDY
ncbi:unnamed protein product [Bemisia tabaci]|uniref:Protein-lysine N-methyltransferase BEMITA_LOCUS5502 n=1 Tax=Bemisia tabaci TaxID=7038 RepID=A0A9P0A8Y4_BEMTA|nr:PREDICTED: protein-lysine N-methyltransferase n6amt2 [Bemisia tabaci]CAH0386375.1 unnamed protein product [Bemisia tabaci]